jgi:hypothetical protein
MLQQLKDAGEWKETPTLQEVNAMYESSIGVIGTPATTPRGRKRRMEQIKWTTVVRDVNRRRLEPTAASEGAAVQPAVDAAQQADEADEPELEAEAL